jgi:hypothetical protein
MGKKEGRKTRQNAVTSEGGKKGLSYIGKNGRKSKNKRRAGGRKEEGRKE